jgi:hypothetical protein
MEYRSKIWQIPSLATDSSKILPLKYFAHKEPQEKLVQYDLIEYGHYDMERLNKYW